MFDIDREELEGFVDAGIELLDSKCANPIWRTLLKRQVDISDCQDCILGQIYGYYADGLERLHIADPRIFGFSPDSRMREGELPSVRHDRIVETVNLLTNIWERKLS